MSDTFNKSALAQVTAQGREAGSSYSKSAWLGLAWLGLAWLGGAVRRGGNTAEGGARLGQGGVWLQKLSNRIVK